MTCGNSNALPSDVHFASGSMRKPTLPLVDADATSEGWRKPTCRASSENPSPGFAYKVGSHNSDGAPPSRRLAGRHPAAPRAAPRFRRQDAAEPATWKVALRPAAKTIPKQVTQLNRPLPPGEGRGEGARRISPGL